MIETVYISTFFGTANYGTCAQSIALMKEFNKLGCNVVFLRKFKEPIVFLIHPSLLWYRIVNKVNRKRTRSFFDPVVYNISEKRKAYLDRFNAENYKAVDISNYRQWKDIISSNVAFVSGSDIIWQPSRGYPTTHFLDFAYYSKTPRFAYASSFGSKDLPSKYYKLYKKYLGSYKGLGLREKSSALQLQGILNKAVDTVVDPTLLLTKSDWDEYSVRAKLPSTMPKNGYILCYMVMYDPKYWIYVQKVAKQTNLPLVILPMHDIDEKQKGTIITEGSLYEFIKLIKDAEIVITDSFHCCVFSTIYEKEFYLLRRARKEENAKFDDFFDRYGLSGREILDRDRFDRRAPVNFETARKNITIDRERSILYLKKMLSET